MGASFIWLSRSWLTAQPGARHATGHSGHKIKYTAVLNAVTDRTIATILAINTR